jgi:hypothetical protein
MGSPVTTAAGSVQRRARTAADGKTQAPGKAYVAPSIVKAARLAALTADTKTSGT